MRGGLEERKKMRERWKKMEKEDKPWNSLSFVSST